MRKLLINGVTPAETDCKFCESRRKMQDEVIDRFKTRFRLMELFMAPQQPHEIRGADDLLSHYQAWDRVQSRAKKTK
jgi:anion-transporting  ArsA/GET3 family ATPase